MIAIVVQVAISLLFVLEFQQNKTTIESNLYECVSSYTHMCVRMYVYVSVYLCVQASVIVHPYNILRLLIFTHMMLRDRKAWIFSTDMQCSV